MSPCITYDPMPMATFGPIFDDLLGQVPFLIYQEEKRPLGMAQIHWGTHRFVHSAHFGGFAIIPELHSQGVGTRLLHELPGILREKKIRRAELCVSADNPRAIAFYEKLGFEHEGTMKKYFSRAGHDSFFDEHMMALFLG